VLKITFLGTIGDIEKTEWNHEKNASILVETARAKVLFDFGERFTRGDFSRLKVKHVVLTHAHKDHAYGLAKLKPEQLKGVTIYCTKACQEGTDYSKEYSLVAAGVPQTYKWKRFQRILKKPFRIEDLSIIPFPLWHSVKALANGFLIKSGRVSVVYCPDVLYINPAERGLIKNADLYIGDGASLRRDLVRKPKAYPDGHVRIGHASIRTQLKWCQDLGIKTAVFTHFGEWALEMREQQLRSTILELGKKYGVKAIAVQDGSVVTVTPQEIKTRLAVTRPGIYLVPPHGELIWEGKKTLIVKTEKFLKYLKKPVYLVSGNYVYGIIRIDNVRGPYNADRIRTRLRERHRISDEEWFKWWGQIDQVFIYEFTVIKRFSKPVPYKVPKGVQTWIKEIRLPQLDSEVPEPEVALEAPVELKDPKTLRDEVLIHYWAKCAAWFNRAKEGKLKWSVDQVLSYAKKVLQEMLRRGMHPSPDTPLYKALSEKFKLELPDEVYDLIERELGEVKTWREEIKGEELTFEEVVPQFKPFYLKKPYIILVGGLVTRGATKGDIDLVVTYPRRVPERDLPMEFRIGRMVDEEVSERLHFLYGEYGGAFTTFVELYDLLVIPSRYRRVVKMEDLRDFFDTHVALQAKLPEERKKEALLSRAQDRIKLFRFFLPAKPQIGHRPGVAYSFEELAKLVNKYPVLVEKKYDGNLLTIHKSRNKVEVHTERGFEVQKRLPGLVKEILSWSQPEEVILCTDTERWTEKGEYIGREEVAAYLRAKTPVDDKGIVANIFDVLYFYDPKMKKHDLNCQIGDLHNEPLSVRKRYLELLPVKQSVIDAPSIDTYFNVAPYFTAKNDKELIKWVKFVSRAKASEGAVIKFAGSKYPLTGACYEWWKYKKTAFLHAIVCKVLPTKVPGVYRYRIALAIPKGWKAHRIIEIKGKEYMDIGKVMNIKKRIPVGTIVEVNFEELFYYYDEATGERQLVVYVAQITGVRPEQTEPDTAEEAVVIAKDANVLREKKGPIKLALPVDDRPRRYVLQIHWRGRGGHGDLRWEREPGGKILDGMTIAFVKKGTAKEDVTTLAQARELSKWENFKIKPEPHPIRVFAAEKAPEPREWLTMEGVVPPGKVGATPYEYGVFYIWDKGKLYLGVQQPYFKEFFFDGNKLKGRWIFRLIPRRKPVTARERFLWLFGKPEDQTPYVISSRAVKKGYIPPYKVSLLPPSIRQAVPKEYQYWLHPSPKKRREIRDALVAAIKKGEVKLEVYKTAENVKYVLQHHYWVKRPIIRVGPTAQHWDLRIQNVKDKPYIHFVCHKNPLVVSKVAADFKPCPDHEWFKKGKNKPQYIPPGQPGNPTKDTPAYVFIIAEGTCTVVTATPMFMRFMFHTNKMKGLWIARREDPASDLWILSKSELPSPK